METMEKPIFGRDFLLGRGDILCFKNGRVFVRRPDSIGCVILEDVHLDRMKFVEVAEHLKNTLFSLGWEGKVQFWDEYFQV
jgi:hypothetical protein